MSIASYQKTQRINIRRPSRNCRRSVMTDQVPRLTWETYIRIGKLAEIHD